jgi:hypothetical protein
MAQFSPEQTAAMTDAALGYYKNRQTGFETPAGEPENMIGEVPGQVLRTIETATGTPLAEVVGGDEGTDLTEQDSIAAAAIPTKPRAPGVYSNPVHRTIASRTNPGGEDGKDGTYVPTYFNTPKA